MDLKQTWRRAVALTLAFAMVLANFLFLPVLAEEGDTVVTTVNLSEYIVFDLKRGSVALGGTSNYDASYTGQGYVYDSENAKWIEGTVSGTHQAGNKYYILQSNTQQVELNAETGILTLTSTDIDNKYMIGDDRANTDVDTVVKNWADHATGRVSTTNYITITGKGLTYDVTIDNIWSTARKNVDTYSAGGSSISVYSGNSSNFKVTLKLKGDNRLAHLFYCNSAVNTDNGSFLNITNGAAEGQPVGSLTVIADQDNLISHSNYNHKVTLNHWDSVIGGYDSSADVCGLTFTGGVIYAGASERENATAIGGGGNGYGKISFAGDAVVTAVTNSTGNAIGGGIAHTASGGAASITIGENAQVYAYNFGVFAYDRVPRNTSSYGSGKKEDWDLAKFVPGTAIGGAGSIRMTGSKGTVTITGGTIYAESRGGAAIGGGSTAGFANNGTGGEATVSISGGTVTAISTSDTLTPKDKTDPVTVKPGTGIGGGSSIANYGGKATVTITGGTITASGIGGGTSTEAKGGDADVTISGGSLNVTGTIGGGNSANAEGGTATVTMSGGTVVSDGIGGGFSEALGYSTGTVQVDGGSLNSAMAAIPKNQKNETLYLTRISFFENTNTMAYQKVEKLVYRTQVDYKIYDVFTDGIGMIYLWLPLDVAITGGQLTEETSFTFSAKNEADLDVDANAIGALVYESTVPRYILTVAGGPGYSLFLDEALQEALFGSAIVEQGVFSYYVDVQKGYTISPYTGTTSADGSKVITPMDGAMKLLRSDEDSDVYLCSAYVQSDTAVWYYVKNENTGEKRFVFDLSIGNLTITEEANGTLTIEQNGYTLSLTDQDVDVYLTTAGYPTSNTVTVDSNMTTGSSIDILADELNLNSTDAAITINGGNVNLRFGEYDNIINANGDSPIRINDNAALNLSTQGKESLKLSASTNTVPMIVGAGALNLDNQDGFLSIQETAENVSQFTVGEFNFEGQNDMFSAELYRGDYKNYTIVGFMQDEELKSLDEKPADEKQFSARGIVEHYNSVKSQWTVNGGYFTTTLTVDPNDPSASFIGYYKITMEDGTDITAELQDTGCITEITSAMRSSNITAVEIKISGEYFRNGNVILYAAADNKIPYTVVPEANLAYNALMHKGFDVLVDKKIFEVFYSTAGEITESNLDQAGTTQPTFLNKGEYTVYFYIREKSDSTDPRDYTPVSDSFTFEITKGTNEWKTLLSCPNIICGQDPHPQAVSKWGTVNYTYYVDDQDGDYTNDVLINDPTTYFKAVDNDAAFYVVATVDASDPAGNYDTLTSDRIHFKALKLSAYAQPGRQLDRIEEGVTGALPIASSGVFSAYFRTTSIGAASSLVISCALPVDTKITFATLSGSTAQYYYYYVQERDVDRYVQADGVSVETTTLILNQFLLMGTDSTTFSPSNGEGVEYQFCIEYHNMTGTPDFSLCLNNGSDDNSPKFTRRLSWNEQLLAIEAAQSEKKISVEAGEGSITVTVKPELQGAGYKFLAFHITGTYTPIPGGESKPFSLVNMDAALSVLVDDSSNSATPVPVAASGDFLLFRIGEPKESSISKAYKLVITNVPKGDYHLSVTADVRMREIDVNNHYAMEGITGNNRVSITETVKVTDKSYIHVSGSPDNRVITAETERLSFEVKLSPSADSAIVQIAIHQQDGTLITQPLSMTVSNNQLTVPRVQTLFANVPNGTYLVKFHYGEAVSTMTVIVSK